MTDVPWAAIPITLLVGIAVGWLLTAESRRLAHEDKQAWRQQCLDANRRAGDLQRQVVRLHRRYRPVGFAPYAKPGPAANGWPDPEPGELIRRGPDPTAATVAVVRGLPAKPARRHVLPEIQRLACPYFDKAITEPARYVVRRRPAPLPWLVTT